MIRLLVALVCLLPSLVYARQSDPPPAGPVHVAVTPPTITLIDPGEEPRQALRLRIAPAQRETARFRILMTAAMSMNNADATESRTPAIALTMNIAATSVAVNGDITYEMSVVKVEVEAGPDDAEEVVKALRESLKPAEGLKGTCTVSDRGIARSVSIELPNGASNAAAIQGFREQIDQVMLPLPEEPVGRGARWTVESDGVSQSVRLSQKVTYTLTQRDGDALSLDVAFKQRAGEQEIKPQGAPPGTSITLRSLASEGGGSIQTLLTRLTPLRSQARLKSVMDAIVGQGGIGLGMKQTTTVEVHISDVPEGGSQPIGEGTADPHR